MKYIDVRWLHNCPQDPVRLVSELDGAGWEQRKLEFFVDGKVGYACSSKSTEGTALGTAPIPSLSEINDQAEFEGVEIDASSFDVLWREYGSAG